MDKIIWEFFKNKGLNDNATAGILGNLFAESGLNPRNLQNSYENKLEMNDEEYTKAVDDGSYNNFIYDKAGYGLAQWTFWSRKEALLVYSNNLNVSIGDLDMQLNFLWKELHSYFSMEDFKKCTSIREASDIILLKFERPADQSEAVQIRRSNYSKTYYDKYMIPNNLNVPFRIKCNTNHVRYRNSPGINSEVNGVITDSGTYTISETAEGYGSTIGWGRLKSRVGWINLDDVNII